MIEYEGIRRVELRPEDKRNPMKYVENEARDRGEVEGGGVR